MGPLETNGASYLPWGKKGGEFCSEEVEVKETENKETSHEDKEQYL